MTIEKQFIVDENNQPLWVVLSYKDWLKVAPLIEQPPITKVHAKRRSGLGMGKGVVIPENFNDELPNSFWSREDDLV